MVFFKNLWQVITKHSYSKNISYIIISAVAIGLVATTFLIYLEFLSDEMSNSGIFFHLQRQ